MHCWKYFAKSNFLNKNKLRESNGINRIMNSSFQMSGTAPGCGSGCGFSSEFHDYRRRCMDMINHLPQIFRPCCPEYIATCNIVIKMYVYVCRFVWITRHGVFLSRCQVGGSHSSGTDGIWLWAHLELWQHLVNSKEGQVVHAYLRVQHVV